MRNSSKVSYKEIYSLIGKQEMIVGKEKQGSKGQVNKSKYEIRE